MIDASALETARIPGLVYTLLKPAWPKSLLTKSRRSLEAGRRPQGVFGRTSSLRGALHVFKSFGGFTVHRFLKLAAQSRQQIDESDPDALHIGEKAEQNHSGSHRE